MPCEARYEPRRREVLKGLGACLAGAALCTPRAVARGLRTGEPAPPATLVTLDGARISSAELHGSVLILTFWATWCTPCREELPLLSDYWSRHAEAGLQILGFSLDMPEQLVEVRRIAQSLRFPVGLLRDSSAPGYGRIWRLPVSFTIDRAGVLVEDGWKEKHPSWTQERLDQVVTPLLLRSS
jgi:peroxiredoxin